MSNTTVTVRRADRSDVDLIEGLLARNGLPYGDVSSKPGCFFVGYVDGTPVGVGGVELRGDDGLLRSVVVAESHRGEGYGSSLCVELERRSAADGIDSLYLLTTTAAAFFRGRGYEEIARNESPPRIRQTTQFQHLCPSSATCMRKRLDGIP